MAESDGPKVDYQSNSTRAKRAVPADGDRPKVQQVAQARQAKKSLGSKFREAFVGNDAQSVGSYIMFDIIVPRLKDLLFDTVTGGLGQGLYGSGRVATQGGRRSQLVEKTNYSGMSNNGSRREGRRDISRRDRSNHNFDEHVIDDRGEIENALDVLNNLIDQYDQATVADYYDAIGITPEHTDLKFGWRDLSTARILPARGGGYILSLPDTEVL